MNLQELKNYILNKDSNLTVDEYMYITGYIEILKSVRYIGGDNCFEIITNDNYSYKIKIKDRKKN